MRSLANLEGAVDLLEAQVVEVPIPAPKVVFVAESPLLVAESRVETPVELIIDATPGPMNETTATATREALATATMSAEETPTLTATADAPEWIFWEPDINCEFADLCQSLAAGLFRWAQRSAMTLYLADQPDFCYEHPEQCDSMLYDVRLNLDYALEDYQCFRARYESNQG